MLLRPGGDGCTDARVGFQPQASFYLKLALYICAMGVALLVYTPLLARQIRTLATHGASGAAYESLSKRSSAVGAFTGVLALTIVGLAVLKPF